MKNWLVWILAVMLLLTGCGMAQESFRHMVTGDVSEFIVDESAGLSRSEEGVSSEATIGTEVYLCVDPNSASNITFYVTDEEGVPIGGALIYISYMGIEELYGVTDVEGLRSMYLFRNVPYEYRVTKTGYETAYGSFIAHEETKLIHVVLRKLNRLDIFVVKNGMPMEGVRVDIRGREYITDENGNVHTRVVNGVYNAVVYAPDGRTIPLQIVVNGDTVVVVELDEDYDHFLVYDKDYIPEDYVLTEYDFAAEDLVQGTGESDADYALRIERYLEAYPSTVFIEAMPDHIQQTEGPDVDVLDEYGIPLYSQRSMMPMGRLLLEWEKDFEYAVFRNEDFGLRFRLDALHNADMAKLFALMAELQAEKGDVCNIVSAELLKNEESLELAGLADLSEDELDVTKIDFGAIRTFEFDFDHETICLANPVQPDTERHELQDGALFENTLFEFRITPILPEALPEMILDGLDGEDALKKDSIMLASRGYFEEELRRWQAEGRLTNTECNELFELLVDGVLNAEEITRLQQMLIQGQLDREEAAELFLQILQGKVYRFSCWAICGDLYANITPLLSELEVLRSADMEFEAEYVRQMELLQDGEEATQTELILRAEAALEEGYDFALVDMQGVDCNDAGYVPGMNTQLADTWLVCTTPLPGDEFEAVVGRKVFLKDWVDIREEQLKIGKKEYIWQYALVESRECRRELCWYFVSQSDIAGLGMLVHAK